MSKYCVYKHASPSGKVYIGITGSEPKERWKNGLGYYRQTRFYRAIQKYGWDAFSHEILFSGLSEEKAKEIEMRLIADHKSNDKQHGYNTTLGGDGMRGYIPPIEVREKISKANKGKVRTEETRRQISKSKMGIRPTEETRKMLSERHCDVSGEKNPMYGKNHSEAAREKMSANRPSKPVVSMDNQGASVSRYRSVREAERTTGIKRLYIIQCCKGERTQAGGFSWKYAEEVSAGCTISSK